MLLERLSESILSLFEVYFFSSTQPKTKNFCIMGSIAFGDRTLCSFGGLSPKRAECPLWSIMDPEGSWFSIVKDKEKKIFYWIASLQCSLMILHFPLSLHLFFFNFPLSLYPSIPFIGRSLNVALTNVQATLVRSSFHASETSMEAFSYNFYFSWCYFIYIR